MQHCQWTTRIGFQGQDYIGIRSEVGPVFRGIVGGLLSLIVLLSGCANLSRESAPEKPPVLSPPKLAPDAVVVQAVFIRFPEEQAQALNDVWRVVDESVVSLSTRRALHANGLQCGVLVGEMPQVVRARLKELNTKSPGNSLELLGLAAEVPSDTQQLHCHAGRRKELALRPGLNEAITVMHVRDGQIQGNTYTNPRMMLDLRATPLGDGRARLKMTPEIQHGQPIESMRVSPNKIAQLPDIRQQQQVWDYMAMEVTLAPGQFFLCTLTDPPRGLGQAMFSTRTSERTTERVLLVIQMVANPLDDLFAPEDVEAARLATDRG
ncbi:MAG: hypothetical protein IT423_20755 [Pirellulaceae bacterium]|nr:hypothetical protein [Pirellulaceae bacterium]